VALGRTPALRVIAAVGQLLPVALAAALSTVPIMVLLIIMLSPRRKVAALPFVIGSLVGTFAVVLLATTITQALPSPRPREADQLLGVLELLLGVALVVLGVRGWVRRHGPRTARQLPGWASAALDGIGGLRALGLGVIIEFRPKSLLLACVAGLQIHAAPREASAVALLVIYVAIATSTMTVPLLLTLLAPKRMEPRLAAAAETLTEEGPLISAIVLMMVGVVVIGFGLQDLA
jgi:hypothetical protein